MHMQRHLTTHRVEAICVMHSSHDSIGELSISAIDLLSGCFGQMSAIVYENRTLMN